MSKSNPKMVVMHVDHSDVYAPAFAYWHIGNYPCYALRQPLLFTLIFDQTDLNIFEKLISVNQKYTEAGFTQVWLAWEILVSQLLAKKNLQHVDKIGDHISFQNLLSFFIVYFVLLSCYILVAIFELYEQSLMTFMRKIATVKKNTRINKL